MRICFGSVCFGWIIGLAAFAAPATSSATSVTITPSNHDTTIFKAGTSNSAGGQTLFYAGTNGNTGSAARSLLSFNLSSIPTSAVIQSVKLSLTLGQVAGGGLGGSDPTPRELDLRQVSDSWGEGTVSTGGGQGAAANAGDATWNARSFGSTNWTAAGGDFSSSVSGAQLINNTTGVVYNWDSTATTLDDGSTPANNSRMVSDVQSWVTNPGNNNGWILINTDETDLRTFRAFFSRENASSQPSLTITYVPEPGTLSLLAVAGVALALFVGRGRIAARSPVQ
jgi:hypothetical protein